jgi:amyloid beta precursor protein binding protein 1
MVKALRHFVEQGDGTLPLPGSLPDMKALSATYVELQLIYRQKASEDLAIFKRLVVEVLQSVSLPFDVISDEEIESFAKNAAYLKVIRGRRLRDMTESHGPADGDVRE